ncbi:unnamed protein product [Symbiodinium sp. CCMP2592]|nr:unnamed protein product [Symbiodinium sp. CCMP2592]
MWAGFSSEEEAVEAPLVMEVPAATNKGPSEPACMVPERPQKRQEVLEMSQPSQPSSQAFDASQLVDAGRLLENACLQEPYRPEDHQLTAEEFWGGTSDSSQERRELRES